MKFIAMIMTSILLATSTPVMFTSCSTIGGASGVVTDVQTWLADPKNQALIQEIAAMAQILIGALGGERNVSAKQTTVVTGKLAEKYTTAPAGALVEIAKDPSKYAKKK